MRYGYEEYEGSGSYRAERTVADEYRPARPVPDAPAFVPEMAIQFVAPDSVAVMPPAGAAPAPAAGPIGGAAASSGESSNIYLWLIGGAVALFLISSMGGGGR